LAIPRYKRQQSYSCKALTCFILGSVLVFLPHLFFSKVQFTPQPPGQRPLAITGQASFPGVDRRKPIQ
jgi:hypothetical protein